MTSLAQLRQQAQSQRAGVVVAPPPFFEESSDDEEEDEQERQLSNEHGEAEEATPTSKKRGMDTDQLYEKTLHKKSRPRPTITESQLTGPDGLIQLPVELPKYLKTHVPKVTNVETAAKYTSKLMDYYTRFTQTLQPDLSTEDSLRLICKLGSKASVKHYLEHLRKEQRNAYLEQVVGKELAEEYIQQLMEEEEEVAVAVPPPKEE